ncbi:MAG: hypothetical protein ACLTW9_17335 [Enterocloster sp.]
MSEATPATCADGRWLDKEGITVKYVVINDYVGVKGSLYGT